MVGDDGALLGIIAVLITIQRTIGVFFVICGFINLCHRCNLWIVLRPSSGRYFTSSSTLSEWLLNSGAYMHSTFAYPVVYFPFSCTRSGYSNT